MEAEVALREGAEDDDLDDGDNDDELMGAWDKDSQDPQHLLYGLERLTGYIQCVAVALTVKVPWPPLVRRLGAYIQHWLDFAAWWLLAAAQRYHIPSMTVWHDLITYGLVLCLPPLVLVLLFHFWTIGDYTDNKVTHKWFSLYILRWWHPCGTFVRSTLLAAVILSAIVFSSRVLTQ
jgi:hypothetical protein